MLPETFSEKELRLYYTKLQPNKGTQEKECEAAKKYVTYMKPSLGSVTILFPFCRCFEAWHAKVKQGEEKKV